MSASLRLSDAELSALQAYAERLFNWLKQFIDPVAIQSSVHSSAQPLPQCRARCQQAQRETQSRGPFANGQPQQFPQRPRGRNSPSASDS
jgi:hypothetical protein